jgi:Dockerin type I domain
VTRRGLLGMVFGLCCGTLGLAAAGGAGVPNPDEARVRAAALRVYLHGMTAEIADQEVGRRGIGELLRLLDDPAFPRRDNVVAFLAYLGGAESTNALVRMLDRPAPSAASAEDERARLLLPHALGRIASRGDAGALDALLSITAQDAAARRPGMPAELRAAAIAALALTGQAAARDRLSAIAGGRVVPDPKHPELSARARSALAASNAPPGDTASAQAAAVAYVPDPAIQTDAHGLTFVNHASVTSPMTAAHLDAVLQEGSYRAAKGDFDGDVPCCTIVARSGTGGTFGSAGDGLDAINDGPTLDTVLGVSAARVKVVNVINFCGSSGTNIIGCSFTPGNGMVVVRVTSLGGESVLWIHEYGHNLGLGHAADSRMIMYAGDNGANDGLLPGDCAAFHQPAPRAAALMSVAGTCTNDGDSLADPIDNCPLVSNENQADIDGNGVGDACDDGTLIADIDLSGRVDGLDLAIFGRAFGASAGNPRYVAAADLNHDGQVDGADLAVLASEFGR